MAKISEIKEQITIPDNVEVSLNNYNFTVKGEKGSLTKFFSHPKVIVKINDWSVKDIYEN